MSTDDQLDLLSYHAAPGFVARRNIQRISADVPTINTTTSRGPVRIQLSPLCIDLSTFVIEATMSILNDASTPTTYFNSLHATSAISRVVLNVGGRTVCDIQGANLIRSALYKAFSPSTASGLMDIFESTTWGGASSTSAKQTYDAAGVSVLFRPFDGQFGRNMLPLHLINAQAEILLYLADLPEVLNTASTGTPATIGYQLSNITAVFDSLTLTPEFDARLRQAAMSPNGLPVHMKSMYQFTNNWQSTTYQQSAPVQASSLRQVYVILRNAANLAQSNAETLSTYVNPLSSIQLNIAGTLFPAQPMVCNTSPPVDPYFQLVRCQHAISDEPSIEESEFLFTSTMGSTLNTTTYSGTGGGFFIGLDVSRQVSRDTLSGVNTMNSAQPVIVNMACSSTPSYQVRSDVFTVFDSFLNIKGNGQFTVVQ